MSNSVPSVGDYCMHLMDQQRFAFGENPARKEFMQAACVHYVIVLQDAMSIVGNASLPMTAGTGSMSCCNGAAVSRAILSFRTMVVATNCFNLDGSPASWSEDAWIGPRSCGSK